MQLLGSSGRLQQKYGRKLKTLFHILQIARPDIQCDVLKGNISASNSEFRFPSIRFDGRRAFIGVMSSLSSDWANLTIFVAMNRLIQRRNKCYFIIKVIRNSNLSKLG